MEFIPTVDEVFEFAELTLKEQGFKRQQDGNVNKWMHGDKEVIEMKKLPACIMLKLLPNKKTQRITTLLILTLSSTSCWSSVTIEQWFDLVDSGTKQSQINPFTAIQKLFSNSRLLFSNSRLKLF